MATLNELAKAKLEAQAAYQRSCAMNRNGLTESELIEHTIKHAKLLQASVRADMIFTEAVRAEVTA